MRQRVRASTLRCIISHCQHRYPQHYIRRTSTYDDDAQAKILQMKKNAQRDANTARCLCRRGPSSISVPNLKRIALFVQKLLWGPKFRPAADPLPGGAGRPKFNQLEMVTIFTYKPSLVRIDARNFELSRQQTHKHTNTPTDRTDYNTLRRSVIILYVKI